MSDQPQTTNEALINGGEGAWQIHTSKLLYLLVVIGYLLGILAATSLTLLNFALFTGLQIAICILLWVLLEVVVSDAWNYFVLGLITCLTLVTGLLSKSGIYWDWLLYVLLVALYVQMFPPRWAITALILTWFATIITLSFISHWNWLNGLLQSMQVISAFIFVALFSLAIELFSKQRERAEQLLHQLEISNAELEEAHTQLKKYADEVEELTIVRERTRLAREIHDSLGHYLSILTIQLETIGKLQEHDPARATAEIAEARQVSVQAMQEVRNAVAALRPTSIANLSLPDALTQLVDEFEHNSPEITLALDLETVLPPLSPDLQVALYRATQEALTNVRKHARATKVLVRLRYENEQLELIIRDNGKGPNNISSMKQENTGFGLVGLRERVELLRGTVKTGQIEPSGFQVTIQIPLCDVAATSN